MNPYAILALVMAWGASASCAFLYGQKAGGDRETATQTAVEKSINDTREAAQRGAADAIAKVSVKNVAINRKLETEVREKPLLRDCPDGVRLYNLAIPGDVEPAGGGAVPAANATP